VATIILSRVPVGPDGPAGFFPEDSGAEFAELLLRSKSRGSIK
jgi:hypothetical protein